MEVELKIDSEAINKQVTEAIINSALGAQLQVEIDKALKEALQGTYNRDNVVKRVLDEELRRIIREVITAGDYQAQLRAKVLVFLADKSTDEIVSKALERLWSKLVD